MSDQPAAKGLSRRQLIKRGAVVGGVALWAPPIVQSLRMPAHAQVGSPPPVTCVVDGWMTGGGGIQTLDVTYTLHSLFCNEADNTGPGFTVKWGKGKSANTFDTTAYTNIVCQDDPSIPNGPMADFDTAFGSAVGTLNGVPGATATFTFVDGGEGSPPNGDMVQLTITNASSTVVLNVPLQLIDQGNTQAHDGNDARGDACV